MGSIAEGVNQAINNCLKIQPGESVVIISDIETASIGHALEAAARKITDKISFYMMEDFGQRPIAFPEEINKSLSVADVSIYAGQSVQGELAEFRMPMLKAVDANPKLRHGHMISITEEIMKDGMCSDYKQIQHISKLVYEKVKNAEQVRVTTERGTDLTGEFSSDIKWVISDGDITPDNWSNLPDGEVFTAPANVNGTIVIDGCLGDFFTAKYGSLAEHPVHIKIENGRAIEGSLQCGNEQLLDELKRYIFETDENSNRVGEFAIGTNTGLTKLIYNLLQDEKFPGIHIAFGSPYPGKTGAKWDSKAHVDGVLKSPNIYVGDELIMKKGKFCIE